MNVTLKNQGFTLTADTLGAQLISLKSAGGFEHVWTGDPAYWTGHAPVLFPIVGALREGKARIGGRWYQMGQHGFARRREFTPGPCGEDSVSFTLTADEETRQMYPFDFALTVTYRLKEDGCAAEFVVENHGGEEMPFAIGGHPGFNLPLDEDAAFEDYSLRFPVEEEQDCPAIVMGQGLIDPGRTSFRLRGAEIPLRHELFYQDALVFENLRSHTVQIVNRATGRGLEMDFAGFPLLGVWSAQNDGPYVCLEPWIGCATRTDEGDDFAQKHRMVPLAPGGRYTCGFSVRFF